MKLLMNLFENPHKEMKLSSPLSIKSSIKKNEMHSNETITRSKQTVIKIKFRTNWPSITESTIEFKILLKWDMYKLRNVKCEWDWDWELGMKMAWWMVNSQKETRDCRKGGLPSLFMNLERAKVELFTFTTVCCVPVVVSSLLCLFLFPFTIWNPQTLNLFCILVYFI